MPEQKQLRAIQTLFTNHLDAWGMTLAILMVFCVVHDVISPRNLILLLAITGMYWFGFAVNDYYDMPYDGRNVCKAQRNAFLVQPSITSVFHWLGLLTVTLAFFGFAQFGLRGVLTFSFSILIVWAYSAPPFRLKSRPVLDVLTHGLFVETYPYLLGLWLIQPPFITLDFVLLAFLFLSSIAAQLEQQIRDFDSDTQVDHNFTTTFGKALTLKLLKLASAGLFVIGGISIITGVFPVWMIPLALLGTPTVLHRFWRSDAAARPEKLIQYSVVVTLGYVCLLWIWMLLV